MAYIIFQKFLKFLLNNKVMVTLKNKIYIVVLVNTIELKYKSKNMV